MRWPGTSSSRSRRFHADAILGFGLVILLLTCGMALAIRRIEHLAATELPQAQSEEREIGMVDRLRWSAELLFSAGNGYLLSGDPAFLDSERTALADFDAAIRALETTEEAPRGIALLGEVEGAAVTFRLAQEQVLRDRKAGGLAGVVPRFQNQLIPARRNLLGALDRLTVHKNHVVDEAYAELAQRRTRALSWLYGLLSTLVIGSVAVAWWAARSLGRTYRREAEALETARKALYARDELMEIVAHDMRSPLGAITMRAELLHRAAPDDRTRDEAAAINNIATRMAEIINAMLDVTLIDAGQLAIDLGCCEVDAMVHKVVNMFTSVAASKHVAIDQRVPERGLTVEADCGRVAQVMSTLLNNALKLTPQHSRVAVSVERSGEVVTFSITDAGPGIPPDVLPRVFDRTWRQGARGTKGTGLALFLAKSIIEAHRGRIWVESPPEGGATFHFTLRRAPESSTRASTGS